MKNTIQGRDAATSLPNTKKGQGDFMFSMEELNELISAIFKLIDKKADVSLTPIAWKRVKVEMNGEYFGIYDFQRHTFVD